MTAPELVIFDCDGVLVDSEPVANAVLARWLTNIGLPTTTQQAVANFKGRSLKSVGEIAEAELGKPLPTDFFADMQAETFTAFHEELAAVPGARELVQWVQGRGLKSCIASSGDFEKMGVTLEITGMKPYFTDRIFSAINVKRGKPAPDLFLHAADKMGVPAKRCVVVEDSPAGVEAARAAQMRVFAYGEFKAAPGVIPVSNMLDIRAMLDVMTRAGAA